MKRLSISRISELGVLVLLVFSVLWRGGKGLEATWLLAIVAGLITVSYSLKRLFGISTSHQTTSTSKGEFPLILWSAVCAYMLLTIASYVHSSVRNYGLDEALRNISLSMIFLWIVHKGADMKQSGFLEKCTKILTIAVTIAAIVGICVYILQPVNRFVGSFYDYRFDTDYWPNAWAEFVLLAWPLMLIQLLHAKTKRLSMGIVAAIGLVMGTLLLSYSRGALLAFGLQLGLMITALLYLRWSDFRYKRLLKGDRHIIIRQTIIVAVIAFAIFGGVNLVRSHFHDVQSVTEKVTFTSSEGTSSIDERSAFWHQSLALSEKHPWLGYGPYSFRFVQPQLMQNVLATSDHAHNMILNTALNLGWPAAILFVLIILYAIGSSTKQLLHTHREWSQQRDLSSVFMMLSVIGVSAHCMIDYNLQFVGIALPFWICLGLLIVPVLPKHESAATSFVHWKMNRSLFLFKLALSCVLLAVTLFEGINLLYSSFGRHAEARGETDVALQWYHKARYELFSRDMHLSQSMLLLQKEDPAGALKEANLYIEQNAYDARGWKIRGIALLHDQKFLEAQKSFEQAYTLGKYTDLGILDLLLQTARDPQTKALLISRKIEFDTLFSDYALAIEQNTHFIALSQNVEELMSVSRELSDLFPTDAQNYKQIARRANSHAMEERQKLTARTPGILW